MDDLSGQIGKRIYERRKQLRLTQDELAELAGVMPQTISSSERAKTALRPENVIRISQALGISTDYLLTGSVTGDDLQHLSDKLSCLTPAQYRHFEDIIDSFLATVKEKGA